MYVIAFNRQKKNNPLTGRARYRVVACYKDPLVKTKQVKSLRGLGASISVDSPRRVGTMVNPTWALFGRTQ